MVLTKPRKLYIPVGKFLFKVSKITLEQRSIERCSNVIFLTLDRYLSTGTFKTNGDIQRLIVIIDHRVLVQFSTYKMKISRSSYI